jgi:hypothetical protein
MNKEKGSSATDSVTDVRKKEVERRKKEVERRKKGCQQLRTSSPSGAVAISIKFL